MRYFVQSYARAGVGKADAHEVLWRNNRTGKAFVLTSHKTQEEATARAAYLNATLGSEQQDTARRQWVRLYNASR